MSKQLKMYGLVEEFLASGMSLRRFCKGRDIKPATLGYWVKKKKARFSEGGFVEITNNAVSFDTTMELVYPNGVRLRTSSVDLRFVKKLLELY